MKHAVSMPPPVSPTLDQHQREIQRNFQTWQSKPLLRQIYAQFYARMLQLVDRKLPGAIVEIGAGIGNLKAHCPSAICTDLFPNPWLDLVCSGYELPFKDGTVSHLVLCDVFHHLRAPRAFLREARRVLCPGGRVIIWDPYISLTSYSAYEFFHHERVHWREPIYMGPTLAGPNDYYTGQGNSTRLFFTGEYEGWLAGWSVFHRQVFAAFRYFLSGGYSKPALLPERWAPAVERLDEKLSRWPRLFGARCLVGLTPDPSSTGSVLPRSEPR